tara:strand:+ start:883 stop:1092 length:210 start_codon:yes stop_codon:yes gene_type:complete
MGLMIPTGIVLSKVPFSINSEKKKKKKAKKVGEYVTILFRCSEFLEQYIPAKNIIIGDNQNPKYKYKVP